MTMRWLLCLLCLVPASPAAALALYCEGSASAATGEYVFTERTLTASLVSGVALETGWLSLRASFPVWLQNSTLVSTSGGGWVPSGGGIRSGAVRDSGLSSGRQGGRVHVDPADITGLRAAAGDPSLQASLRLLDAFGTNLRASFSVKVPVSSTDQFGTGEWDVGGAVSLGQRIGDATIATVDVSYWYLGDLPTLELRDPLGVSVRIARVMRVWAVGVSGSVSQSVVAGYDPPVTVGGELSRNVGAGSWGVQLGIGLSDTTPDVSAGVLWRLPIRGR
jgi:hypothetical protein